MPEQALTVNTEDGTVPATLYGEPGNPGVLMLMDAFGPRPALADMARRLAGAGYVVLLPDLFYRFGQYGPFDAATAFQDEAKKAELMKMIKGTTQAMTARDTGAFLDVLAEHGGIGPVGVVGYCMGGARALTVAAEYPLRIAAAASFHGGGLASEAEDSPHLRAAEIRARVYVGCAGVDRSFPPEQSARLAQSLREAEVDHIIENYVGMSHGWAVPDHSVHDPAGAERHWTRLLTLFDETLR
ncbi:dienelactone hydrolase family protein [Acidimangrovimonas pyrenivorans]|uniref:Dienelactone hydrolase family protein n=1 Tax=Acidimangrovimonas pyrenivorans TaxID=2030798 RepID=A0ABV7AD89_9RHOB